MSHYHDLFDIFITTFENEKDSEGVLIEKKIQEIVAEWLRGKTIQFYDENKGWTDWAFGEYSVLSPMTKPKQGWRVKPADPWVDSLQKVNQECQSAYIEGWKDAEKYHGFNK